MPGLQNTTLAFMSLFLPPIPSVPGAYLVDCSPLVLYSCATTFPA